MLLRLASLISLLLLPMAPLQAATIEPHNDPFLGCVVRLSGQIESGDAEKLTEVMISLFGKDEYSDTRRWRAPDNMARLCLDSPGGSLPEAVRILDTMRGTLGTAIARGSSCLSACSIVFMGGTVETEGDAGRWVSRKLHAGGKLGFHAPALVAPNRNYSAEEVNAAFKIAVRSIGVVLERSALLQLSDSLVAEMLKTPPESFFYIDTVGKAARWRIPVVGSVRPAELNQLAISNACNAYSDAYSDVSLDRFASQANPGVDRWGWPPARINADGAQLEGFGQEGALSCILNHDPSAPISDETQMFTSYAWAQLGEDDIGFEVSATSFFDRATPLASLIRSRDDQIETRPVGDFAPVERRSNAATCYVFRGSEKRDQDPCQHSITRQLLENMSEYWIEEFVWPSGAKTVLDRSGNDMRLNGNAVKTIWSDKPIDGDCYLNTASGNTFCHKS